MSDQPEQRLSWSTLPSSAPSGVRLPPSRGLASSVGIVHLGIGAFHRAHQAVMTEDACIATNDSGWGICAVTQRSPTVVEQLKPQDGLYTLLERNGSDINARVVAQVQDVMFAADEGERLLQQLADPGVRIVTLTVTEKGYRRRSGGGLDLDDEAVSHDLSIIGRGQPGSRSIVGQLVRGIQARIASDAGPITVLSCDNLTNNGKMLRGLVHDFVRELPGREADETAAFIDSSVTFPSSMVDRMVPATTNSDRAEAQSMLGLRDEAVVVAEPFHQWIIEDNFAAGRPAWEHAGATLVDDVAPYEQLKLRVLNGTHSMLAYLGALKGYETIAEAVADPELAEAARRLVHDDVTPTLDVPIGVNAEEYAKEVLTRFANTALGHRTTQVAMDGSQKIPIRLLGTARDRLAAGAVPQSVALAVAAWMAYVVAHTNATDDSFPLDDPLADRLRQAVADTRDDARSITDALLSLPKIFGTDLQDNTAFSAAITAKLERLL